VTHAHLTILVPETWVGSKLCASDTQETGSGLRKWSGIRDPRIGILNYYVLQ